MLTISIVTVTYNSKDTIAKQIRSVISSCLDSTYKYIIVDNGSLDGTPDRIEKEFPDVHIIRNNKNRGFGRANNQGVEVSSAPFVLFLNPDMQFPEGERLLKWIDWMRARPEVGISGCKLLKPDGELNLDAMPRRFPRLWEMIAIFLKLPHVFPKLLDGYLYRTRDFTKEQEVDSVRGSCMLVRREVIEKIGHAFDPRYFIWFEDVDLCCEAKKMGYTVMYTPVVSCVDLVGQSFKKKTLLWKQWQFARSAAQYFWKWR